MYRAQGVAAIIRRLPSSPRRNPRKCSSSEATILQKSVPMYLFPVTSLYTDFFEFLPGIDDLNILNSDLWLLEIRGLNATWRPLDPSTTRPNPRAAHSTILSGSQLVVTAGMGQGGEGTDSVMFDSWVFDIPLERWQRRQLRGPSVPSVAYHTQHYAPGPGLLFIFFGASNHKQLTNTIFYASTEAMLWNKLKPAGLQPVQRAGHAAAAWGSNMVIFGGVSPRTGIRGDTWWFETQSIKWSELVYSAAAGVTPSSRAFHAYDIMGPYMLVHGGLAASDRTLSDMWSFHSGSKKWQLIDFPSSNAPEARSKHSLTVVNDNSDAPFVVIFGGITNEGTLNEKIFSDTWIFRIKSTEVANALCKQRLNGMGRFDGSNNLVIVGGAKNALRGVSASAFSAPGLAMTNNVPDVPTMTLEAWVQVTEFNSPWQSILSLGKSVTIQRFAGTNSLSVEVCGARLSGALQVHDATWHHVALVVGGDQIILYIDELVDAMLNMSASSMDVFDYSSALRMGFGESMRSSYFYGLLDDVRLWSIMRTKEEIISGMWSLAPSAPGLEGWWQFVKSNLDGIVTDVSPKKRNGNSDRVARLRRPAIARSTVPCDRPIFLSQKQLSRGSWEKIALPGMAGHGAAGGHRRDASTSPSVRRGESYGAMSDQVPKPRHSHTAITVSSTRILIHGGVSRVLTSSKDEILSDLWMFDEGITTGNPWQEVPPLSAVSMYRIYGHNAVLWQKHSLMGFGAAQQGADADVVKMLTINANFGSRIMGMSPTSTLPALAYFSLVKQSDNSLIAFGGDVRHHGMDAHEDGRTVGTSVSNALYMTKPDKFDAWGLVTIPGNRPPAETWGHGLVQIARGVLLLFAGMANHHSHAALWTYGVTEGTWTQRAYSVMDVLLGGIATPVAACRNALSCKSRHLARYGHSATGYAGKEVKNLANGAGVVVIFGGAHAENGVPYGDVSLIMVPKAQLPTVFYNLDNTGESKPGGALAYKCAPRHVYATRS